MSTVEVLRAAPQPLTVEAELVAAAIDAAAACAIVCSACASACLSEGEDMAVCVRDDLDCADVCGATARVLARPARLTTQGKDTGAWPLAHACVGADVRGGEFWGPDGWQEATGRPAPARARPHARDPLAGARLWAAAERATGVRFDVRP